MIDYEAATVALTDEHVLSLEICARRHGDDAMVSVCKTALCGLKIRRNARFRCAHAIVNFDYETKYGHPVVVASGALRKYRVVRRCDGRPPHETVAVLLFGSEREAWDAAEHGFAHDSETKRSGGVRGWLAVQCVDAAYAALGLSPTDPDSPAVLGLGITSTGALESGQAHGRVLYIVPVTVEQIRRIEDGVVSAEELWPRTAVAKMLARP